MKNIDVARLVGILANVGVLVGILLLVYELNQNRQMMRGQTRAELTQALAQILFELSDNASVVQRGNAGDELSAVETEQYRFLTIAQLRYHENVFYQYRNGLYDETEYLAQRETWRSRVFADKGLVDYWCQIRTGFSAPFVTEINGLLTAHTCDSNASHVR